MPSTPSINAFIPFLETWFIIFFLILEFVAKIGLNPVHQLSIVTGHSRIESISDRQRNSALSVSGLVVAGLAIIVRGNPSELGQQVEVFGAALGLLLIAAFAHELTQTYSVVLTFQELAFEYGLLMMVYGLYLLIAELVPSAQQTMAVVFIAVFIFRFWSVVGELQAHRNQFKASDYKTRREYIRTWTGERNLRERITGLFTKNPATILFLVFIGSVYLGELSIADSTAPRAAYDVVRNLPRTGIYVFSPWLHSYHLHILENAIIFALLGGWTERKAGTYRFATAVIATGYITNLLPYLAGFGGFGLGISGVTNVFWALFMLTHLSLFYRTADMESVGFQKAGKHFLLFAISLVFVLNAVAEYIGYVPPPEGSATTAHVLGVALGFLWFLSRRASPSVKGWIKARRTRPE